MILKTWLVHSTCSQRYNSFPWKSSSLHRIWSFAFLLFNSSIVWPYIYGNYLLYFESDRRNQCPIEFACDNLISSSRPPIHQNLLSTTMDLSTIESFILNPAFHDYLAILKGARNGFVYGVKVRIPHAVVMSILFGRGE